MFFVMNCFVAIQKDGNAMNAIKKNQNELNIKKELS